MRSNESAPVGLRAFPSPFTYSNFCIDVHDELWCFGGNQYGQLGLGDKIRRKISLRTLVDHKVAFVTNSKYYSLAWTPAGECYGTGEFSGKEKCQTWRQMKSLSQCVISLVCSGFKHTLVLDTSGRVFVYGNNKYGQCGLDPKNEMVDSLSLISTNVPVNLIAAGGTHSLFVDQSKTLWTFGDNRSGQLGLTNKQNQFSPIANPKNFSSIRSIHGSKLASFVLDEEGTVFYSGRLEYREISEQNQSTFFVPHTELPHPVIRLIVGCDHCFLIDQEEEVWAFGQNLSAQCGITRKKSLFRVFPPSRVPQLSSHKFLDARSMYSFMIDKSEEIRTFGSNNWASCGESGGSSLNIVQGISPQAKTPPPQRRHGSASDSWLNVPPGETGFLSGHRQARTPPERRKMENPPPEVTKKKRKRGLPKRWRIANKNVGERTTELSFAQGSNWRVWQVQLLNPTRLVAGKQHNMFSDPRAITLDGWKDLNKSMVLECLITIKCQHPNVIQFIGVAMTIRLGVQLPYWLFYELGECTLEDWVKSSKPDVNIKQVAKEILSGLVFLQQNNIVHGDLKLDNIIIVGGVCKISDFSESGKFVNGGLAFYSLPHKQLYGKWDLRAFGILLAALALNKLPPKDPFLLVEEFLLQSKSPLQALVAKCTDDCSFSASEALLMAEQTL